MKVFLRIVIVLLAVALACVAVWYFVFKPTDDENVNNKIQELVNYIDATSLDDNLIELRTHNGFGENYENVFYSSIVGVGYNFDAVNLSRKKITNAADFYIGDKLFMSYLNMYGYVEKSISAYYPYTTNISAVSISNQNVLYSKIDQFVSSVNDVKNSISSVDQYQKTSRLQETNEANQNISNVLADYYGELEQQFRNCLSKGSILCDILSDYVKAYAYGNNFYATTEIAFLDSICSNIGVAMGVDTLNEIDYVNNVRIIKNQYKSSTKFNVVSEIDFLFSYNYLNNNAEETLTFLTNSSQLVRNNIVNNVAEDTVKIKEAQLNYVQNYLKVIGF